MKKLSKRAKEFIQKYQQGGTYIDPLDPFDQSEWSSLPAPLNSLPAPPIKSDYSINNFSPAESRGIIPTSTQESTSNAFDFIGAIPAIGKLAIGISSLVNASKQRKKARQLDKEFKYDTKRRMEEGRANNFYATPYTTGRMSNFGKSYSSFQEGGISLPDQVDTFMQMYEQQRQQQQQNSAQINDFYNTMVQEKKQQSDTALRSGLSSIGSGLVEGLNFFLQQGGSIPKQVPKKVVLKPVVPTPVLTSTTIKPLHGLNSSKSKSKDRFREKQEGGIIDDLYSPDFQSPWEAELNNETSFEKNMKDWIFQDESVQQDYSINDLYFGTKETIAPVVSKLSEMGLTPSSVNTGRHNVGSKHYQNKAVDLGLNTSFGGDRKKMDAFYQFLNSPEGLRHFPNVKVIDERTKPPGQKEWSGAHIHLELK